MLNQAFIYYIYSRSQQVKEKVVCFFLSDKLSPSCLQFMYKYINCIYYPRPSVMTKASKLLKSPTMEQFGLSALLQITTSGPGKARIRQLTITR